MKPTSYILWALLLVMTGKGQTAENDAPIRVLVNDWTSQRILAQILGQMYETIGYQVKYSVTSINEQWGSLSYGIDHVQVEVWEGTMSQMFSRVVKSGRVLDAGSHSAKTREDWWYPLYVETHCPGLPDWQALKNCAAVFADEPGGSVGRYIAGPWEKPEAARIRALGLNFKIDALANAEDLWAELKKAQKSGRPIVMFNWTPNWVEAVYPGRFVEFPEYHEECETNPEWGLNPQYHHDCGNPKNGWLKKAAWAGVKKQWPCAWQTLKNFNFDNKTIADVASWVDYERMDHQTAAKRWLNENQPLWQSWIPPSCKNAEATR